MATVEPEPEADRPTALWKNKWSKERICRPANTLSLDEPVHADRVRFVCISDTHYNLGAIVDQIPAGDVLLHCGDFTNFGDPDELEKFNADLARLPHKHKIVIAGNHELGFEDGEDVSERAANQGMWQLGSGRRGTPQGYKRLTNCTYLHDSSTTVYGLTVYGTSWHPLAGFSFYRPRGKHIHREWMKIPPAHVSDDGRIQQPAVHVLMTHTPPLGHCDWNYDNEHWGDADLLNCIERRIKPLVHVFGHVHEPQPRATTNGETLFINAAICNHANKPFNSATIFDLPVPEGISKH